jgi:hypothetical protein
MRTLRFSKLVSLGLLSAAIGGASGCSSDYGLFAVHTTFPAGNATDRQSIEQCQMSISDGKRDGDGKLLRNVMVGYQLELRKIPANTALGYYFVGCGGSNQTPQDIGRISYSTSRTTGSLIFLVDALDNTSTPVWYGESDPQAVKVFQTANDEVKVEIVMNKGKNPDAE